MPVPAIIAGAIAFAKGVKIVVTSAKFMKLLGMMATIKASHAVVNGLTKRLETAVAGNKRSEVKTVQHKVKKESKLRDRNIAKLANEIRKAVSSRVKRGIEFTVEDLMED